MTKVSPAEFVQQVKQEASRVTWSSKKEVMASTLMVLLMVLIASLFFLLVDSVVFQVIQWVLGIRS